MSRRRLELSLSALSGAALTLSVVMLSSCDSLKVQPHGAGTAGQGDCVGGLPPYQIPEPTDPQSGLAQLSLQDRTTPLATINGVTIPLAELQDRLDKQSPYVRAKYVAPDKRKELLDQIVQFEVLAQAAAEAGYASHPEVLRQTKQAMIQKYIDGTFAKQFTVDDITEAEVAAYYDEHKDEYNKPEQVRVSHILVADQTAAQGLLAKAEESKTNAKAWKDLVSANSLDEETKTKGGDLGYFAADDPKFEEALVSAAFGLKENGDLAVVQTSKGWHVLKLTGRRKALKRELKDVQSQIQQKLYHDRRKIEFDRFVDGLREKARVSVEESALDKLKLQVGPAPAENAPPAGGIQGMIKAAQEKAIQDAASAAGVPAPAPGSEPPAGHGGDDGHGH